MTGNLTLPMHRQNTKIVQTRVCTCGGVHCENRNRNSNKHIQLLPLEPAANPIAIPINHGHLQFCAADDNETPKRTIGE